MPVLRMKKKKRLVDPVFWSNASPNKEKMAPLRQGKREIKSGTTEKGGKLNVIRNTIATYAEGNSGS